MIETFILISIISVGSFGNNLVSFFAKRTSFEAKRSLCFCGKKYLGILELIPLFSYIFLKGKCKTCSVKLPARYLLVEILITILGFLSYLKYGATLEFLFHFIIIFSLIIIGTVDKLEYIIPNKLVLLLLIISIIYSYFLINDIAVNLIFSLIIVLVFTAINLYYKKVKDIEAIGYGDIKLLAVLSLLFSFPLSLIGIWFSSLLGITGYAFLKGKNEKIPFGFFISISFILISFFDKEILSFYYKISGAT